MFGLTAAPQANGDETYTYVGTKLTHFDNSTSDPDYSSCAAYSPNCKITGSFTVSAPIAPDQNAITITPTSFSFTDGPETWSSTDPNTATSTFTQITTDSSGNIIGYVLELWDILPSTQISANLNYNSPGDPFASPEYTQIGPNPQIPSVDYSDAASSVNGTWTASPPLSPTPEPSSVILWMTGILALGILNKRQRKNGMPNAP